MAQQQDSLWRLYLQNLCLWHRFLMYSHARLSCCWAKTPRKQAPKRARKLVPNRPRILAPAFVGETQTSRNKRAQEPVRFHVPRNLCVFSSLWSNRPKHGTNVPRNLFALIQKFDFLCNLQKIQLDINVPRNLCVFAPAHQNLRQNQSLRHGKVAMFNIKNSLAKTLCSKPKP